MFNIRFISLWVVVLGIVLLGGVAFALAQIQLRGAGGTLSSGCIAGTLGVDSNVGAIASPVSGSGLSNLTQTISTTNCPDEIVIGINNNTTINSVTSPHLTFVERGTIIANTSEWVASVSNTLINEVITIALSSGGYTSVATVAETGIHLAAPFDSNINIPQTGNPCNWTTSNANDLLITITGNDGTAAAPGWTQIASVGYLGLMQKVVSATQSAQSSSIAFTASSGNQCDALIQGP